MSFTHAIEIQNGKFAIAKVLTDEGELYSAVAGQPNFDLIVTALLGDPDESVIDLFDVERAVEAAFRRITERVTVKNRTVFYDGDVLHNGVSKQILRLVEEGDLENLQAVANFTERVMTNPQEHSRDQLFTWLDRHKFTITPEGLIVMYKGCNADEHGRPVSSRRAPASDGVFRNDEPVVDEYVLNLPGDVITMPRSNVDFNAYVGCSIGLHAGTFAYASTFASLLQEVHVDPRDVVSVPTDCDAQKVRVCRYTVVGPIDVEYANAVLPAEQLVPEPDEDDDEFAVSGDDVEWERDIDSEDEAPFDSDDLDEDEGFQPGDRVKTNHPLRAASSNWFGSGFTIPAGSTGVVDSVSDYILYVTWDDKANGRSDGWGIDFFDKVAGPVEDVTTAEKWDTRFNYTKQKRGPGGKFAPKQ